MTEQAGLRIEQDGGVLRVTIARPALMNALDLVTMTALGDLISDAATDPTVRVVVLTGEGKAFCTGADLAAAAASGGSETTPDIIMDTASRLIRAIVTLPVPVIAKINGPAAGVGVSIALAADFTYAARSAYLLLAFINIGLMPDGGSSALVAAAAGRALAAKMALLGERLSATEAAAHGLITEVCSDDELDAHVDAIAARLAKGPRRAIELTKRAVNAGTLTELDAALAREKAGQTELLTSPDFIEGMTAMLTRRPPNFDGRLCNSIPDRPVPVSPPGRSDG